jgi:hypothetical protein
MDSNIAVKETPTPDLNPIVANSSASPTTIADEGKTSSTKQSMNWENDTESIPRLQVVDENQNFTYVYN